MEEDVNTLAKGYKEVARAHHRGAIVKASKRSLATRWLERALPVPPSKSPAMGGYRKVRRPRVVACGSAGPLGGLSKNDSLNPRFGCTLYYANGSVWSVE